MESNKRKICVGRIYTSEEMPEKSIIKGDSDSKMYGVCCDITADGRETRRAIVFLKSEDYKMAKELGYYYG